MTDQQKTVAIIVPSGQDGNDTVLQEVTVVPGSTAQDVLNGIGRGSGYILATMGGNVFGARDLLFGQVQDGDKLAITPSAEAGASAPAPGRGGLMAQLARVFTGGASATTQRQLNRTPVATPSKALHAHPVKAIRISPQALPAWGEKGWRETKKGVFDGYYHTAFGPYRGRVEFGPSGFRRMYIWNAPRELWTSGHPKWPCFAAEGGGRHQIHMHIPPASPDSAILNVERIFNEVRRLMGRRYA